MKKLILIRHSKTIFERDIPSIRWILSEEGQQLAYNMGDHPLMSDVKLIYASDQNNVYVIIAVGPCAKNAGII